MTFLELQNEVITDCFKEGQRSSVKRWINQANAQLWRKEMWTFKLAEDAVTVTTGSTGVTNVASDFGTAIGLWNADGARLSYLEPQHWNNMFYGSTDQTAPSIFTVINRTLKIGPISDETSSTYLLLYERLYGHYTAGGTFAAGDMTADTDYPATPDDCHWILVPWARMIGKGQRSDPTVSIDMSLRDEAYDTMRSAYLADQRGEYTQWGADPIEFDSVEAWGWQ